MANPKARRVGTALLFISILAVVLCGAVLHQYWPSLDARFDRERVGIERVWRKAAANAGVVLPGTPNLRRLDERLAEAGQKAGDPILMRIFKREFKLELWMFRDGRYHHFTTYPICNYSGRLGPKLKEGDRQSPEGFYTVAASQLNPNSRWHRSFNLGFPNAYDSAHGRTGSFLMVHGGCSSIGCYAMTNDVMTEIWELVTAALNGGQKRFQVQVFPFRMTEENLAARRDNTWADYWRELKVGHDLFDETGVAPKVYACKRSYKFQEGKLGSTTVPRLSKTCPKPDAVAQSAAGPRLAR